MTVRIAIRHYSGDRQQHGYRIDQPGRRYLVPVHAEWRYPDRHPLDMVSAKDLPSFGGDFDCCPGCGVWARQNRHTVVVRGQVQVSA